MIEDSQRRVHSWCGRLMEPLTAASQTLGFITLGIIDDFADAVVADVTGLPDALDEARAAGQEDRNPRELRDVFSTDGSSEARAWAPPSSETGRGDIGVESRPATDPTIAGGGATSAPSLSASASSAAAPAAAVAGSTPKTSKFCVECGTKLPRAAKFCFECGYRQPLIDGMQG